MPSGKPTLRDVAKAAGFSPMTASNALHGKPGVKDSTRAKVLAVAEKLDYRINLTASMLKSGRSNIIHIIVNEFDSPFYSKLVESLVTETTARGLTPFVEQTRYSPDAAKHALANNPFSGQLFDGEIIHASGLNAGVPLSAINHGRPLVLIDACEETPTFDTVNFPNEDGARAAVQHLIECGCHRIAIVGDGYSPRTELAHVESSSGLRLRGASGALLDAGLPYDESTNFIGYGSDSGIEAGQNHVKVGLLLSSGSSSASSGSSHSGGGNTKLFLQSVNQLGQFQNSETLDLFDHSGNFLRHCICLLIVIFVCVGCALNYSAAGASAAASSAGAPFFSAICFRTTARPVMGASMVPRT